jgi:cyclin-dependent kinase 1
VGRLGDDKDGMELLAEMLIYNPSERMSAKAAIVHPFFKDFDKSGLPVFNDDAA